MGVLPGHKPPSRASRRLLLDVPALSLRTSHFVAFLPGRTRQAWFTTPLLAFAARRNGFFSIAKSRAAEQAEELEDHPLLRLDVSDMTFSEPLVHELEPRGGSAGVKSSKRMPVTI
mmetsp:Transcript_57470/g.168770  ORF Transcript_57470/g.168770 Transcript_57470/m.168770 type:complete len:116 (-) Transcript_57470:218-565(-)